MTEKLIGAHRQAALAELHGWVELVDRDAIRKTFHFASFVDAFCFMTKVAMIAEKMNHHPEWFNVYDRVEVVLTTHDVGGLSERDIAMARRMDEMAPEHDR